MPPKEDRDSSQPGPYGATGECFTMQFIPLHSHTAAEFHYSADKLLTASSSVCSLPPFDSFNCTHLIGTQTNPISVAGKSLVPKPPHEAQEANALENGRRGQQGQPQR